MEFLSGFESTYIHDGQGLDVLDLTEHSIRFREDFAAVADAGVKTLRYSIPWHKIERERGAYDWRWLDAAMAALGERGLDIIADPLHHTSFPDWLTGGFADRQFVTAYVRFVLAFADRYPRVRRFTYINEPLVTSWFAGHEGVWHPYGKSADAFVVMALNCAEAICRIDRALRAERDDIEFVHVESCERHFAETASRSAEAEWNNHRRFLVHDLISGRVTGRHPMLDWLRRHGLTASQELWFVAGPAKIDVLGLDFYQHCEIWWGKEGRIDPPSRHGFARIAMDYAARFPDCDVMLSETNVRGTPSERAAHFRGMVRECEKLEFLMKAECGRNFRGFCWYPFIDSCDWDSLCTRADGRLDPQGILSLSGNLSRVENEFSREYAKAANATSALTQAAP